MGIDGNIVAYRFGSSSKSGVPAIAGMAADGANVLWQRYIVIAVALQLKRGITEIPVVLD